MMKLLFAGAAVALLIICVLSQVQPIKEGNHRRIDGIYILVSETITPGNEKGAKIIRKAPEWTEIIIFSEGTYSRTRVATERKDDWVGEFPKDASDLGYDSEVGTYDFSNDQLKLTATIALNPFKSHGTTDFSFREEAGLLVLTSRIPVHSKSFASGDIVTILRKISAKEVGSL